MKDIRQSDGAAPYYPGTKIVMIPGDVLYSHKTAISSLVVGHSGIVGEDFRIYHVNRWGRFGHADKMSVYLSRHKPGEKLTILRYEFAEDASKAARWAKQHIQDVEKYAYTRDLTDYRKNYCSKFVWQAFYFGSKVDLTSYAAKRPLNRFIKPFQIYQRMGKIAAFRNKG